MDTAFFGVHYWTGGGRKYILELHAGVWVSDAIVFVKLVLPALNGLFLGVLCLSIYKVAKVTTA